MTKLLPEQTQRLERLSQRPASEIDLSDMPETTNWEGAVRDGRPGSRMQKTNLPSDPPSSAPTKKK